MWIKKEGAFAPIVPAEVFFTAQGILRARARKYTDEELIDRLRSLYQNRGVLSGLIIDEMEGMPTSSVYAYRFGSLIRAYQMVGFTPTRDYQYLEVNRFIRRLHPEIIVQVESKITELGGHVIRDSATDLLTINKEFSASIVLARCQTSESGRSRWKIRFDSSLLPDITIAVRLDPQNQTQLDYFLLPRVDFATGHLSLAEQNSIEFDSYRSIHWTIYMGWLSEPDLGELHDSDMCARRITHDSSRLYRCLKSA
jgi:hypothetical protein